VDREHGESTEVFVDLRQSYLAASAPIVILRPVVDQQQDIQALKKARSLLLILLATCKETLLALDAAANALDTDMTDDLRRMIARSEGELQALNGKIEALN